MKNRNCLPFVVKSSLSQHPFARIFGWLLLGIVFVAIIGCGGGGGGLPGTGNTGSGGGGRVIIANPTDVLPWSSAEALPRGTTLFVRLNRVGTEVREYPVTLIGSQAEGPDRFITCQVATPLVVGFGDSGSPVVTKDGKLVAVLFGGFDNDSHVFLARAAEDVVSVASRQAPDVVAFSSQSNRPMALIASGVPDRLWNIEFGGQKPLTGFRSRATIASSSRVIDEIPAQPIAGQSVAVMELSGDAANMYAVGTLSMPINGGFVAFGHPYLGSGQSILPVRYAATDTMVGASSGLGVFKWAHPIGSTMGTMSQDSGFGCAINWGVIPNTIPVVVEVTYKGQTKTYRHQAAAGRPLDEAFRCFVACAASADAGLASERVTGRALGELEVSYVGSDPTQFTVLIDTPDDMLGALTGQLQTYLQTTSAAIDHVSLTLDVNGDIVDP